MQIANFVLFGFQLYAIQFQITSVPITFDFGIWGKILVNNLLQGLSLDVSDECDDPCTHECTVDNGCITMELDCHHVHGDCGYSEGTPCTHTHGVKVASEDSCYKLLCSHKDGGHDNSCGYVAAVEAHECHYECAECAAALTADETAAPSTEATTEPSTEATEPAPICDCGTDDALIHATTCAVYVAPETPVCYCAEKCTEVNEWCDVCGFDYTQCGGADTAVGYSGSYDLEDPSATLGEDSILISSSGTDQGVKYQVLTMPDNGESGTVSVCGYNGVPGDITIPGTLYIQPSSDSGYSFIVTEIAEDAFNDCSDLTSIIIPSSVTSIGVCAFMSCDSMETITFAEGSQLTTIESSAFMHCGALTKITLPASVTSLGNFGACDVFHNCPALTGIFVAEGNTAYKDIDGVLYSLDGDGMTLELYPKGKTAESFTTPEGVTTIGGGNAFAESNLKTITLSNGVKTIEKTAFRQCFSLTTVTLPASVTYIDNYAFDECQGLTTVNAPCNWDTENPLYDFGSVNVIVSNHTDEFTYALNETDTGKHDKTYSCCGTVVTEDHVSEKEENKATCKKLAVCDTCGASYGEKDAANHTYESNDCCGYCGVSNIVGINNLRWALTGNELSITGTGDMAEYTVDSRPWAKHAATITSVTIGETVPHIGTYAFRGFTALTEITIPASVVYIDEAAFSGCTALTKVTIPNSVTTIASAAFRSCTALTEVTIPNSVTFIGSTAFMDCTALKEVTIPASVTKMDGGVFDFCDALTTANVPCNWNGSLYSFDEGVTLNKAAHEAIYRAEGNVIYAYCTVCKTDYATATVTAEGATYNGAAQETASVAYSDGWNGGDVTFTYNNNVKAGTATAKITLGEATASVDFTIEPKALTLSLTSYGKEYDGTNLLTGYHAEVEGFIFYDEGSYEYDGLDYDDVYDDVGVDKEKLVVTLPGCTVGEYTTATVTGITLIGEDAGNYTIASQLENVPLAGYYGTFSIDPMIVYITPEDQVVPDGQSIDPNAYTLDTELPEGHTLSGVELVENEDDTISVKMDDSGNIVGVTVTNAQGVDVTDCFTFYSYTDGKITRTHEGHTFNENGFCATGECDNYQSAVAGTMTDEYGNESECYLIYNAGQLYWFAQQVNEYDNNFICGKLMADITVNADLNAENLRFWTPIGSSYPAYTGHFDGNGKTISGLYVKSENSYVGLFGGTDYGYQIKNIHITNSYFEGNSDVGALIGYAGSYISGCTVSDSVTVVGNSSVGGIVGSSAYGELNNCRSAATVTEAGEAGGGLVGNNYLTVTNCYTTASKLVGYNNSEITNSYYLSGTETEDGGKTAAQFESGEVAYLLQSGIEPDGYWDENDEWVETEAPHIWGQTIGTENYPVFGGKKVYRIENTGCSAHGEYGYSNDENGTYAPEHSFPEGSNGFCTVCDKGYEPAVLNNGVYEISNAGQLYWFADFANADVDNLNANAILTADILVNTDVLTETGELKGSGEGFRTWTPIGTDLYGYGGTFDGNGMTISGLYFQDSSVNDVGLFGAVTGGTVQDLGVIHSYFRGAGYVGSMVGYNRGTITNCYNTGTVRGNSAVGGVVGCNDSDDTVTNCYNSGTVSGENNIGGVVGTNQGTTMNCYNTGSAASGSRVGGAAGINASKATMTGCYNSGTVSGTNMYVGGVVGINASSATVSGCHNTGTVTGSGDSVGGVAGENAGGTLASCNNAGNVTGSSKNVGGVVGYNRNTNANVTNCYNTGTVSGSENVGGVVGQSYVTTATVTGCYNTGTVSGTSYYVGGVVGRNYYDTVTNCYYLSGCATDGNGAAQFGIGNATLGVTTADVTGQTDAKTEAQFASGEVTFLLNGSTSEGELLWGQNIDNGEAAQPGPVFSDAIVYKVTGCNGEAAYSNTDTDEPLDHNWAEGKCTRCGLLGGYYGDPSVNGGKDILWTLEDGKLTISGTGPMADKYLYDIPWQSDEGESAVTSVSISEGVTHIGKYVFSATKITEVTIPASVETIAYGAFLSCYGLKSVTFTEASRLTTIGENAFSTCTALTALTIPAGVTSIGDGALSSLRSLTGVSVAEGNTAYKDADGVLYSADGKTLLLYPTAKEGTAYAIPAGVTTIVKNAFEYNSNLTSVTIPVGVTTIGERAFASCSALTAITVPGTVTTIGQSAFADCAVLQKLTLSVGLTTIESNAFRGCKALTEVTIPNGVTSIGNEAFGFCKALTEITIPASVTSIGEYAFMETGKLATANVPCTWDGSLYTFGEDVNVVLTHAGDTNTDNGNGTHTFTCTLCGKTFTEEHSFRNGFCVCDAYEPALLNGSVYEISNAGQLYWFMDQLSANRTANGKLMKDITVNENVLTEMAKDTPDTSSFRVWNTSSVSYAGTFEGNGKTVSGLYFNDSTTDDVGLFGRVAAGGTVENLTVSDSYFCGNLHVGGIAGQNSGTVSNCVYDGIVIGYDNIGGIAGNNEGTVKNCTNEGTVTSNNNYAGGMTGRNHGTVESCTNNGAVTANNSSGGLVGENKSVITDCCNTGTVSGGYCVGGIVGFGYQGFVTDCRNTGTVSASPVGNVTWAGMVGGVVGKNDAASTTTNCSSSGSVTATGDGNYSVGGVVGDNAGTVKDCYNTGHISGAESVGGVAGGSNGTVTNCYYLDTAATGGIDGNDAEDQAEATTEAQLASGEVAYLLGSAWGQTIGTENTPVLGGEKVYPVYNCGNQITGYANTQASGQPQHSYGEPIYSWTEDPTTLTVTLECTVCSQDSEGHTLSGSTTDMDVTTSADGFTTTYTATVTLDGKDYTDYRTFTNEVTSVNITWGSMDFTYTDESGWNNPDTAWVQVENTGNTAVSVTYDYVTDRTDITGSFWSGTSTVLAPVAVDAETTKKIWLRLDGRPGEALNNTTIGSVKLTIE